METFLSSSQKEALPVKRSRVLLAIVLLLAAPRAFAQPISSAQKVASVPAKYHRAVSLLQLLARSQARTATDTSEAMGIPFSRGNVARIVSLVSARGVTIVDMNINGGKPRLWSKAELGRDLARFGSDTFDSFANVGYDFFVPLARYSRLRATPTPDGVIIQMGSSHRFTWAREQGHLQLRKLEYLVTKGK